MQYMPSMVIADLGMPGEDGLAFIRSVRQTSAPGIPAIALSAYADEASREAALAAGFNLFVAKPAPPEMLVEVVASLLNSSRSPR